MIDTLLTVEKLTTYIRELLESDRVLQDIWVEGEVSSFTIASSGHAYLTLQESNSRIDAVMWRAMVGRQSFIPRVGDNVVVHGQVTVYERQGRLQLAADVFQPAGIGILQMQLEQLRQKLEAEGLFDPARKRPLPSFPHRIGVATSATGAVWHDIQNVIARRFPMVELVLAPTLVQGDQAPDAIVSALSLLQGEDLDLIILARGGGSMEDLWCFNDERVARAIFACRVPVISAIGHETDVTIADYVADQRAPTPSAAAELAVPDLAEIVAYVESVRRHIATLSWQRVEAARRESSVLAHRLDRASPQSQLRQQRVTLDALQRRLTDATRHELERKRHAVAQQRAVLASLEPAAILRRGYSLVSDPESGKPVSSVSSLRRGDRLRTTVRDGSMLATVDAVQPATESY
ncbi:MAG TPA: exodeoxyribonuclease VII large subunit [Thermomicrobiales bacterium]|nr:exodeoxyribonuclease VII large subunit [Thermomicrobiales bacterium]